jgi:GWxTD domain-containing protein
MKRIILFFVFIHSFTNTLPAQYYEPSHYSGVGLPYFDVEFFQTFATDGKSSRVFVFAEFLNDDLTFVKADSGDGYTANYEFTAAIYDDANIQVDSKTVRDTVLADKYELTNSRDEKIQSNMQFNLPKGIFEIKVQLSDLVSKKATNNKYNLKIDDYTQRDIRMSDILFLKELEIDSTGTLVKINPSVNSNFTRESDNLFFYYNLYLKNYPETLEIKYIFEDLKEKAAFDSTVHVEITKPISEHYFEIPKKKFEKNGYTCTIRVSGDDIKYEQKKKFSFFWTSVPETKEDIVLAIRQMRYIDTSDSLKKMLKASLEDQQKFFAAYWNSRDPNPSTVINELMEEYFRRVNYANREYSSYTSGGWTTDRGRILIKFGFPDDIERHPYDLSRYPWQVWRYYALRKVFLFTDRTGFGDYRLDPSSMDEEYR